MLNKLKRGLIFSTMVTMGVLLFYISMTSLTSSQAIAALTGSTTSGWSIYTPSPTGFRYGPSIIINADNSIDMWFASEGGEDGAWDWIRYRHSTDYGLTWTPDAVALKPTLGSDDYLSTCDPGVIKFGGYYYIGYTSTTNGYGLDNNVFVARSTSPSGPYEKWNGTGWGGDDPKAFIAYNGPADRYGAGEPSFVVKDGVLYIYYTWQDKDGSSKPINQTRVSTADPSDPNWPGDITYQGIVNNREEGEAAADVKYIDSLSKFVAASPARSFSPQSYVRLRESTDGIHFTDATLPRNFIQAYSHNVGISGTETGHINTANNNFVSYAYGTNWGAWSTYINPITYTSDNLPATPIVETVHPKNGSIDIYFNKESGVTYNVKYGTASGTYTTTINNITSSPYAITGLTNGQAYYIVMSATNVHGESGNTVQYHATPLAYTSAPRTNAFASSEISGWAASKAIDGTLGTAWSSNSHDWGTRDAAEWLVVDTGGERSMKRLSITPQQNDESNFGSFAVNVSEDNVTWREIYPKDYKRYRLDGGGYSKYIYEFNNPVNARYVRLVNQGMSVDEQMDYYFRIAELQIDQIAYSAYASSTLSGWHAKNVLDGWTSLIHADDLWSSVNHGLAASTEWLAIDTGGSYTVTGIRLQPRTTGVCFPVDFKLQSSNDGVNWLDIAGQSYTNYPNPADTIQTFKFATPVTAQYFRVYATKLASDGANYYFQLSEFILDMNIQRTAVASSTLTNWEASNAADNVIGTNWSTVPYGSELTTAWIYQDIGSARNISGITIVARINGIAFPKDFKLQSSTDASTWLDIPGQAYTSYANPGNAVQHFVFSSLVNARYFRMYATKLSTDDFNVNYYFQLSEMYVNP